MKKIIFLLIVLVVTISCTEPYGLQTDTFEDALVIEATITDEFKKQEIKISRTFTFEETKPKIETGATVYITDDLGNQYNFNEENDKYVSEFKFQAVSNRQYSLFVNTSNGKQYTSTREKLTTVSPLTSINATKTTKFGVNGVEITANSYDPTGTSNYYRYEYEETYKIVSPYWTPTILNLSYNYNNFEVTTWFTQKNYDSSICYNTVNSNELLLINNSGVSEDRVTNFPVRFVPQENHILAYRYSILVKQYIQNLEAYTFYKTLKDFSTDGSVLSPVQSGFIEGNINNSNNPSEKVIGFFDVSSFSSKRIFFNYNDIFEGEPVNKYHIKCKDYIYTYDPQYLVEDCNNPASPPPHEHPYCEHGLFALWRNVEFLKGEIYYGSTYQTTLPICGECSRAFSTVVPPFWID